MTREELLQNAKPILFNTEMVRAILDGRKSVTRRVVKPQPEKELWYSLAGYGHGKWYEKDNISGKLWTPPCHADDILYVRETWQYLYEIDGNEQIIEGTGRYYYASTDTIPFDTYVDSMGVTHDRTPWRPSIHMPKEAARIFLKVTDVMVDRLHDITDEQAKAEGIRGYSKDGNLYKYAVTDDWWIDYHNKHRKSFVGTWWQDMPRTEREAFSYLWNSTIKKSDLDTYGWDANPWVWVIDFERIEV